MQAIPCFDRFPPYLIMRLNRYSERLGAVQLRGKQKPRKLPQVVASRASGLLRTLIPRRSLALRYV